MLNCCCGYSNHGSRNPAGLLKFSARTVTKKIPDPFVFLSTKSGNMWRDNSVAIFVTTRDSASDMGFIFAA